MSIMERLKKRSVVAFEIEGDEIKVNSIFKNGSWHASYLTKEEALQLAREIIDMVKEQ